MNESPNPKEQRLIAKYRQEAIDLAGKPSVNALRWLKIASMPEHNFEPLGKLAGKRKNE